MIRMASMKNLLGDMDFEEFEVTCRTVLEKLTSMDVEMANEPYHEEARKLFNYWIEIGGRELIQKWVRDRGGYILELNVEECMTYMYDSWIGWLEGF